MTTYKDDDNDDLCDWCGEPDHSPAACPNILGKGLDTFKRAILKRRKKSD